MGNCMESWTHSQEEGEQEQHQREEGAAAAEGQKKGGFSKEDGLKIKILLTKEELEWLIFELKEKGGKKLEDVLVEIERGRGRNEGWKPSLESIMESPEVQTVEMY